MRTRQAGESALLLLDAVDLLLGLRGLGPDAYARATVIPFQNSQLRVVGREDFVV
jgi:hypothetical protein